ncbi:hypothetical protein ACMGE7_11665 [Macrococcus equi]|uniref:hypothetical protein n=1 Tax=Macrococcus equi TaxID=3395462 RepID=UPI0039BEAF76
MIPFKNISKEDKSFLDCHGINSDEYLNKDVNELLNVVDELAISGLDDNDEATELYYQAQTVYNNLYSNN